jgi:hypothetical protein
MFRTVSINKNPPSGKTVNDRVKLERAHHYAKINTDNEMIGATSTLKSSYVKYDNPERAVKCKPAPV